MTEPIQLPAPAPEVDVTDPDNPWYGIPAALVDGDQLYDLDSAGGCG